MNTTLSQTIAQRLSSALGWLVGALLLVGSAPSFAQQRGLGEPCTNQSDCAAGLLCTNVGQSSACLLACPTGQCLFSETCQPHPTGQRVCKCDATHPCKGGLPCLNGTCPAFFCEAKTNPCPPGTPLICYQPIANVTYGLCIEKCSQDSDCPPTGTRCTPYNNIKICYCRTNNDCKAGLICVDSHCHTPCTKDSDCPKGNFCDRGSCEPRLPGTGEPDGEIMAEPSAEQAQEATKEASDAGTEVPETQEPSTQETPPQEPARPDLRDAPASDRSPDDATPPTDAMNDTTQDDAQAAPDPAEPTTDASRPEPQPEPDATSHDTAPPPTCGCNGSAAGSSWLLLGLLAFLVGLSPTRAKRQSSPREVPTSSSCVLLR